MIQSVFELDDGSGVVVTVGKYVTPNHMDITGNGIEPDFPRIPGNLFIYSKRCNMQVFTRNMFAAWSTVMNHLSQCNMKTKE